MLADIFGPDLLIVVIVLVVVLFGGAAIPKLARNLGSAKNEFEKGLGEAKKNEAKDAAAASATGTVAASNGTAAAADTPAPAPSTPSTDDTAQGN
jgi:sec-independent protein translocase protein TatA